MRSRVILTSDVGAERADKAHRGGSEVDPDAVWDEAAAILQAIGEAHSFWGSDDPKIIGYPGYLALDAGFGSPRSRDAWAGLLPAPVVHRA